MVRNLLGRGKALPDVARRTSHVQTHKLLLTLLLLLSTFFKNSLRRISHV